jgi:glutathione peroxidase
MLRMLAVLAVGVLLAMSTAGNAKETEAPKALSFKMKSLDGKEVDLKKYQGKVVLIVNVASQCGLTPQYEDMQALHEKYSDKGLVVLGFPCNQFGAQEPGSADEIRDFCKSNYGVTFDMFAKIDVNGENACPLYKHLTSLETQPKGAGKIGWNFEKFLLDRQGHVIGRFDPQTSPRDPEIVKAVEGALARQ